jgi:hypothetical protein
MDKIRAITIILSGMTTTYQVGCGQKDGTRIIASIERTPGCEDAAGMYFPGNFIVKDRNGNKLAEISDTIPYVITYA